jgi:hypothetical protein
LRLWLTPNPVRPAQAKAGRPALPQKMPRVAEQPRAAPPVLQQKARVILGASKPLNAKAGQTRPAFVFLRLRVTPMNYIFG